VRDAGRFDDFYQSTYSRLVAYLYAVSGDPNDAQDAAQEAYTRAWQRWKVVGDYADPEQWVRTVGWRIMANRLRHVRRREVAHRRHGPPDSLPGTSEDAVALIAALRRLPAAQRIAVVLFYLLDLSVADIAEQTGSSVGAVKVRLSRGRHALAELLGSSDSEDIRA
jgi:RNA polymerase sigma-70 factor (ECF subfamily)